MFILKPEKSLAQLTEEQHRLRLRRVLNSEVLLPLIPPICPRVLNSEVLLPFISPICPRALNSEVLLPFIPPICPRALN
ncbi:hypothetical protein AML91_02685 [Paenibacillus jilunlii]|uniref:Uncharacterized protein n=1 Tax=Paenibacillus jilunlii TaxID=682956 RepID=A0ABR5T0D0_9BACL|nr:hypothetical protein AML91_02685 [Paenibacillus jilunlii]